MPKEIFVYFRDAVKAGRSARDVTLSESYVVFKEKNRFLRDISALAGISRSELKDRLRKGFTAIILVEENKHFSVT